MNKTKVKCMREAGKVVADVLLQLQEISIPGNTTGHLNDLAKSIVDKTKFTRSSFYGFKGFPAYVCTSLDDEIVHGIPSYDRVLEEGSILSIDFAAAYRGWHGDACITVPIGKVGDRQNKIMLAVKKALYSAIQVSRIGRYVGDISYVIQSCLQDMDYTPVLEFTGHGIGRNMHEAPQIRNFGEPETGNILKEGMTFAIEPIAIESKYTLLIDDDGWTVRAKEKFLSAHFEHTVLVTSNGPEIITKID